MIDLTREFMICLAVAWSCFAAGIWAIRYSHCADLIYLGRYLIALCPIVLSLFSSHSVNVCEQVIMSKRGEAISGRVYLTSVSRADCGDGYEVTVERYSDGTTSYAGQMPVTEGRAEGRNARLQDGNEKTRGVSGRMVPLSARSEPAVYWDRHGERDL